MVIYHLDARGGWADATRTGRLASPSHSYFPPDAKQVTCHRPRPARFWCAAGRDPHKSTRKEGALGSAQSWASQNNGVLVENSRCYHEKLIGVFCSQVWAFFSVYDCHNSLLRTKHLIRSLLPSYSENRNEDWLGSRLPTANRKNWKTETDSREFIRSFIHFTHLYCVSSCARNYFEWYNYKGESISLYLLSTYCTISITPLSPIG